MVSKPEPPHRLLAQFYVDDPEPLWLVKAVRRLLRLPPLHRHDWEDGYVFDSVIRRGSDGSQRVLGQAVMMFCKTCQATRRRHLRTWREARVARKLIAARDSLPTRHGDGLHE